MKALTNIIFMCLIFMSFINNKKKQNNQNWLDKSFDNKQRSYDF